MPQVSSSTSVVQEATQLKSYVNGDLPAALNKLNTLANALNTDPTWKGRYADEYHSQTYPSIQKASKAMAQDLQQISQAVGKIVADIMTAGGN
jgi:uncharacterized protein YukE